MCIVMMLEKRVSLKVSVKWTTMYSGRYIIMTPPSSGRWLWRCSLPIVAAAVAV